MGRPKQRFLLLDINDVTRVCGSMYSDELVKILKIRHNYLSSWLTFCFFILNFYLKALSSQCLLNTFAKFHLYLQL